MQDSEEDVRLGVQMFLPTPLMAATNLARLQEEKNIASKRSHRPEILRVGSTSSNASLRNPFPPIKKLSPTEIKERRDGLCLNCDERYSPGHRCRTQRLYLLDGISVEEIKSDQEIENAEESTEDLRALESEDQPEVSLHSISGTVTPQIMRVKGSIGRHIVMVLIDSGSTHNFVDPGTTKRVGMIIQLEGTLEVMVANGERLISAGCCKKVTIVIQGISISIDFYILNLEGCQVVLGAHWLRTLGPILWDFSNLWMEFTLGKKHCQLKR